ncbi:MAG: M48 family metallopeptidase [Candidatus Brocadiaceae bacterium]|nr:M48 family metallopeptidase [Candidatus Brocadiaceae bacterium]
MKFVPKYLNETEDISKGDQSRATFLKNTLSLIITLGIIYFLLGVIADLATAFIPDRWEARIFSWKTSSDKTESQEQVNIIFERLITDHSLRKLPYTLHIIPGDKPNAFALPGGTVLVTQGLVDNLKSEIGIAMVLGHELGHHQHRHCLKRLGRGLLHSLVFGLIGNSGQTDIMQKPVQLAELRYSRDQEIEADTFGLRLVYSVFHQTKGATDFFEFVMKDKENDSLRWISFLQTHPYTPDRIELLKKLSSEINNE